MALAVSGQDNGYHLKATASSHRRFIWHVDAQISPTA